LFGTAKIVTILAVETQGGVTNNANRLSWWMGAFGIPIGFFLIVLGWDQLTKLLGFEQLNYQADTVKVAIATIPRNALVIVLLLVLWRWSRWRLHGPLRRWSSFVWWTVVLYVGLGVVMIAIGSRGTGHPSLGLLVQLALASALVGISEELAYRGFSLNGFARKLPVFWAVVASALLFGLAHAGNIFGGSTAAQGAGQVVNTTGMGLILGWIYIFSGRNIWLVAALHALWDFNVFAYLALANPGSDATSTPSLADATLFLPWLIATVLAIIATVQGWRKYKGYSLEQALGLVPAPEHTSE
jgi:membrane protease YdiL (CAAX protease family)